MTESSFQRMVAEGAFDGLTDPKPKKGGRRSRDKGNRAERSIVNLFLAHGIHSERVPLSGAAGGSYTGDLTIAVHGQDWLAESKVRASGFAQLYTWIEPVRLLFVRANNRELLVTMRARDLIEILGGRK